MGDKSIARAPRDDLKHLSKLTAADCAALSACGAGTPRLLVKRVADNGLDATAAEVTAAEVTAAEVTAAEVTAAEATAAEATAAEATAFDASAVGATKARLRDALAGHILAEVDGKTRLLVVRWLTAGLTNWREVALLMLASLAAWGVVRASGQPEHQVVAVHDLPAFQVIGAADVREDTTEADFGTYAAVHDVVGRFPTHVVAAGEPLRRDRLSRVAWARPEELAGRRITALPVSAQSAVLAVPRTRVTLLLTPRQPRSEDAGAMLEDVIVLDTRAAGDAPTIVVALHEKNVTTLAQLLGSSLVHVVQQVASPPPP